MSRVLIENEPLVECIEHDGTVIAHIVRAEKTARNTEFITAPHDKQQVGFIVYPAGGEIQRHTHRPIERRVVGMSEVLLVRKGLVEVDFYTDARTYIDTRTLRPGDLVVLVAGGHGFRCLEDTVLLEIKQGPYIGQNEKERF